MPYDMVPDISSLAGPGYMLGHVAFFVSDMHYILIGAGGSIPVTQLIPLQKGNWYISEKGVLSDCKV